MSTYLLFWNVLTLDVDFLFVIIAERIYKNGKNTLQYKYHRKNNSFTQISKLHSVEKNLLSLQTITE